MLSRQTWIWTTIAAVQSLTTFAEMSRLNSVTALVGDTPITTEDVTAQTAMLEQVLLQRFASEPAIYSQRKLEMRQNALETLIERQLILKEFENQGYILPEKITEERIKERIRTDYGDRLTLTKTLQAKGITFEAYKKRIREQVIVDFLSSKHVASITLISPFEINKYYEENLSEFLQEERIRVRMISIAKVAENDTYASKLLGDISRKISSGSDFSELAKLYHQGSQRASGGDWGWVDKGTLREDLSQAAFALKQGEMSEILTREEGCYLLLVEERQEAQPKPLASVQEEIEDKLLAKERSRLKTEWIERLKEKSFVQYF